MNPTLAILGIITCVALSVGIAAGTFMYGPGWLSLDVGLTKKAAAAKPAFSEICVGKVVYLQFDNAVVTKVRPDGKIWTCGGV